MKKRHMLLSAMTAVALLTVSYQSLHSFSIENNADNSLLFENVEALSKPTEVQRPCDNNNGYRQWSTGGFLRTEKEFYDCCYQLHKGYNPQEDCK